MKICFTQKILVGQGRSLGRHNFSGETNLHVSRLAGQLIIYYTESGCTTLYCAEHCAVRHDRDL